MAGSFRLLTLGRLELVHDGEATAVRGRKELALVAYLAARAPRGVDRDRLMAMFWGDRPDDKARPSLRQALFSIRSVVGEGVHAVGGEVRLDPAVIVADMVEFERAVRERRLRDAAALWGGEFLPRLEDLGDDDWRAWLDGERARLTRLATAAFEQLVAAAEASGDRAAKGEYQRRLLEIDPEHAVAPDRAEGGPGAVTRLGARSLLRPDLVGRRDDLVALSQALTEAVGGVGRAVLVEGPAGSGKTRLLDEFARAALSSSGRPIVTSIKVFSSEREIAWSALRALLGPMGSNARGIAAVPGELLARLAAIVPTIAERFPAVTPVANVESGPVVEAALRLIAEVSHEQPAVLVVDDAAEADSSSALVLADLIRRPPAGLLLVAAARSEAWTGLPLGLDLTQPHAALRKVALRPLTESEVAALLGSTAPFAPEAVATLAERLTRETGGLPALVTGMLARLVDSDRVGPNADGVWVVRGSLAELPTGGEVSGVVAAALATLSPDATRLAELAAVLGPAFGVEALERGSGFAPERFRAALGALLSARLFREPAGQPGRLAWASEVMQRATRDALAPSVRSALRHGVARRRRWVALAAVAIVGLAAWWWTRPDPRQPAGTGVLLAEVANATGDSVFDRSLGAMARIELQQSSHVWIVPRNQIAEALQRMGRPDTGPLRGELAREVAVRENVPVVAEIDVARAGSGFVVGARLIDAATGRDQAVFSERAAGDDQVLDALATVAARIRRALGETRRSDSTRGLPPVSTRSLAALQQYALGNEAWDRGQYAAARDPWHRAVALDSTFGTAYARLANSFAYTNNRQLALDHVALAERFADRMTEPERLTLAVTKATVTGSAEAGLVAVETLARQYPTPSSLYNLGTQLMRMRRCNEAVVALRRAIALRPTHTAWINIATCHQLSDSVGPALEAYDRAAMLDSMSLYSNNINQEWGVALIRAGRAETAESVFRRMALRPDPLDRARGYRSLGYLAMYRGRYAEAIGHLEQSLATYTAPLFRLRTFVLLAHAASALGDPNAARGWLDEAGRTPPRDLEPVYLVRLAVGYLRAGDSASARRWLREVNAAVLPTSAADQVTARFARVLLAAVSGDERAPVEALGLEPGSNPFGAAVFHGVRAAAFARLGQVDSALATWGRAPRALSWGTEEQDLLDRVPLVLAEASVAIGDTGGAKALIAPLLLRWANADSGAIAVRRARALGAAIGATPASPRAAQ